MCGKTLCMEFLEKFRGTRERIGHIFGILTLLFPNKRSFARRFFVSLSGKMCNAFLISARPEPGTKKIVKKRKRKKKKNPLRNQSEFFFPVTALQWLRIAEGNELKNPDNICRKRAPKILHFFLATKQSELPPAKQKKKKARPTHSRLTNVAPNLATLPL